MYSELTITVPASMEKSAQSLGEDLIGLIDELGGRLESAEDITRLESPKSSKACFKLLFEDGRMFKGRRFKSAERRKSVSDLVSLLEGLPFSPVIATHGAAIMEEWIIGSQLLADDMSADQTRKMATILGTLHAIEHYPENPPAHNLESAWYIVRLRNQLAKLVQKGRLESDTRHTLIGLAESNRPGDLEAGIIHTDYHPRNMVIDQDGEIWIIDNEGIRLGACDFDIARCWRQWPMTRAHREVFCSAYSKFRSLDVFFAHQKFWGIYTLALSAKVYLQHGRPIRQFVEDLYRISRGAEYTLWPELPLRNPG